MTHSLQLPNAIYMADVFHLLDSILPKKIGVDCYNLISDHLKQMIYSKTKEGFDSGYKAALDMIQNRDQQYAKYEKSLHEFAENKDTYATYILCKKRNKRKAWSQYFRDKSCQYPSPFKQRFKTGKPLLRKTSHFGKGFVYSSTKSYCQMEPANV